RFEVRGAARILTLLLATLLACPALAQQPAPGADKGDAGARKLFGLGKYAEALDIYATLYAETTHPTYLRNVARCYQNLGEPDKAISAFREYLRQAKGLPADQRATINGYIREMEDLRRRREAQGTAAGTAAPSRSQPAPAVPVVVAAPVIIAPEPAAPDAAPGGRGSRAPAFVVGGASLAALAVGAVFGS